MAFDALTKGPFNALLPIHDLNAALVSFLTTHYHGFTSAAGHIGRKYRVDHDISLLVPEVWSRMFIPEREPEYLIQNGYLETFLAKPNYQSELRRLRIQERLAKARTSRDCVHSPAYRQSLIGMIGTDPELV